MSDPILMNTPKMSMGILFDEMFKVWKKICLPLAVINFIIYLPTVLVLLFLPVIPVGFLNILQTFLSIFTFALSIKAASCVMRGQFLNWSSVMMEGGRYFAPMLGAMLLIGLVAGLASLLLVIPGILVYISSVLMYPAKGIQDSWRRSRALVKGCYWRVFGYSIVLWLIIAFVNVGDMFLNDLLGLHLTAPHLPIIASFFFSLYPIFNTVLYFKRRAIKEGADLEAMVETIEVTPVATNG
jgi:hypothetical protein